MSEGAVPRLAVALGADGMEWASTTVKGKTLVKLRRGWPCRVKFTAGAPCTVAHIELRGIFREPRRVDLTVPIDLEIGQVFSFTFNSAPLRGAVPAT